jgi:hypothetical protein
MPAMFRNNDPEALRQRLAKHSSDLDKLLAEINQAIGAGRQPSAGMYARVNVLREAVNAVRVDLTKLTGGHAA